MEIGFDWRILSVQPLPAAQGGALLSAKNRHLPFWYIYIYIHLYIDIYALFGGDKKKVTQKTNNTENIEENTIEKTQQKNIESCP